MNIAKGLLMDIGNSTVVFAETDGHSFFNHSRVLTSVFKSTFDPAFFLDFECIVVSSVVPDLDVLFQEMSSVFFVTPRTVPTLRLCLDQPDQVGADRLVNALGAYSLYSKSCLIIDVGTAITFCVVTASGAYQGGLILPGMGLSAKALHDYTAKLPLVEEVVTQSILVGKTTEQAIQSGLYFGTLEMMNGLILRYKKNIPDLFVIGTGSGMCLFDSEVHLDVLDLDLTLKGLLVVYNQLGHS